SGLSITCHPSTNLPNQQTVSVQFHHHKKHKPYYNIALPPKAVAIIRENLDWSTPNSLTPRIQDLYPTVTGKQVHRAWTDMSETLWKRDPLQLPSATMLLRELDDDIDVFAMNKVEGVEQLCWGMKRIGAHLKGKIIEIGIDATYNTNSKNLELYSIMGEYDNAGFPLSYCLLSTATAIEPGKRKKALIEWAKCMCDTYSIMPRFTHTDKDMAEIGMLREVWDVKIQLCCAEWIFTRAAAPAAHQRLAMSKASTTPYNVACARGEFQFIDSKFIPPGHPDTNEYEGGVPDNIHAQPAPSQPNPN
ncbi:hypothetical protein DFH94DRAFT_608848, partial [Russula ochroleuca]